MTVREWLSNNNRTEEDTEICIYDENGMSPYDDDNVEKYFDAECLKIEISNDEYTINVYFSKDFIYNK